jgi:hypothetical protein
MVCSGPTESSDGASMLQEISDWFRTALQFVQLAFHVLYLLPPSPFDARSSRRES